LRRLSHPPLTNLLTKLFGVEEELSNDPGVTAGAHETAFTPIA